MGEADMKYGGYTGKILRVNLTRGLFDEDSTARFLPRGMGGRGIAAEIAWEDIPRGMGAFDAPAPLIIMTGPLTGTMAPFSGRTTVCGLAPQGYPVEWYTRSSFGGHWGPELKYAGFDGLVITGSAPHPVYIKIENGRYSLEDARKLWGKGLIESQKIMLRSLGDSWRIFSIGPAGENRVRIAVAATETESASGQGGFGAVMGSKNLKAIAVRGNGSIPIADPDRFQDVSLAIREEAHGSHGWPHTPELDPKKVKKYGQRFQACTQGCAVPCYDARYYTRVPSRLCPGKKLAGQVDCIAGLFPGIANTFYDWKLGFEQGFEISQLTNDEGLNHWDLLVGIFPWLRDMKRSGKMHTAGRRKIDLDDIHFWEEVVTGLSRRNTPFYDLLAEGLPRFVAGQGIGEQEYRRYYPAWGYAGHWDGHGDFINRIFFPFWIVSAVQWAVDTRDPISSGHGYVQNVMGWCREHSPEHGISWDSIKDIGEWVYGSRAATDPESGYKAKAKPAYWHGHRSVMKDSLPVDDQVFPRIYSKKTDDHHARVGDLSGPQCEHALLTSATGIDWNETEFEDHCARVIHLERQLLIRNFDRSREDDESVIPYFEMPENRINPFIGSSVSMDGDKFRKVLDEYYDLRGWDRATGRPTPETLSRFKLPE